MNNPLRGGELYVGPTQIGSDVKGTARHNDVVELHYGLSKTRSLLIICILYFLLVCVVVCLCFFNMHDY